MAKTIPELFFNQAVALVHEPLFFVKHDGNYEPILWSTVAESVEVLAAFLLSQGVKRNDRVLLLCENRPEWGIADLAIQSVGAWTVPLYPNLTTESIRCIAADCEPVVAIGSTSEQVQKLLEALSSIKSVRCLIPIDSASHSASRVISWQKATEQGRKCGLVQDGTLKKRIAEIQPEDIATLIYTSGTTGEPKGVELSHHNFLSNVQSCLMVVSIARTDRHLSFLPLSHVFERMAGWYMVLWAGGSIAFAESMETVAKNMIEVQPTIMLGVPRFFEKLYAQVQEGLRKSSPLKQKLALWALNVGRKVNDLRQAGKPVDGLLAVQLKLADRLVLSKLKAKLGGRLRFFISGGAPLSRHLAEFFLHAGIVILEGYGLTETSPVITVNRPPLPRPGSVGKVIPGVEVRIAQDGEILTRGPHLMKGYYHKPEATAALLIDGWFYTGDIGHLDKDGYLYITDRKKDLIKTSGGKFIAPQKLEQLLLTDNFVSQVFVYGDRRPYCVALIVPNFDRLCRYAEEQGMETRTPDQLAENPQIREFFWQRIQEKQSSLPHFEQIKRIALLSKEFSLASGELTPTLKIKRQLVASRHDKLLEALYETTPS